MFNIEDYVICATEGNYSITMSHVICQVKVCGEHNMVVVCVYDLEEDRTIDNDDAFTVETEKFRLATDEELEEASLLRKVNSKESDVPLIGRWIAPNTIAFVPEKVKDSSVHATLIDLRSRCLPSVNDIPASDLVSQKHALSIMKESLNKTDAPTVFAPKDLITNGSAIGNYLDNGSIFEVIDCQGASVLCKIHTQKQIYPLRLAQYARWAKFDTAGQLIVLNLHEDHLSPLYKTVNTPRPTGSITCAVCGESLRSQDAIWLNGRVNSVAVCRHCYGDHNAVIRCVSCGTEHLASECQCIDDRYYCSTCVTLFTDTCTSCGAQYFTNTHDDIHLCASCKAEQCIRCDRCGKIISKFDVHYSHEHQLCTSCYGEIFDEECVIDGYYFKPTPVFFKTERKRYTDRNNRFFGVELEIAKGGYDSENASALLNIANVNSETGKYAPHMYTKRDGSIADDAGFECVTNPMTLPYHKKGMPWKELMRAAMDMGYRSHNTNSCGLHIHVNRSSLGNTPEEQDSAIGRILFFLENNWNEIICFTRRAASRLDHWACRFGYEITPQRIFDKAKEYNSHERHVSLNMQNSNTIEFRIFRGTLKYNTLIATLQFVNAVCELAIRNTDADLDKLTWVAFLSFIHGREYAELIQYLNERGLDFASATPDPTEVGEE